eukprot:1271101-Amphidinium_carterae.2
MTSERHRNDGDHSTQSLKSKAVLNTLMHGSNNVATTAAAFSPNKQKSLLKLHTVSKSAGGL